MTFLTILFLFLALIIGVLFLIDFIRFWNGIITYWRYGMATGAFLVLMGISLVPPLVMELSFIALPFLLILGMFAFLMIFAATCMGMYCCSALRLPDLPAARVIVYGNPPRQCLTPEYSLTIIMTVLLAIGYTWALFKFLNPDMSEDIKKLTEMQTDQASTGTQVTFLSSMLMIQFAYAEEIIFRLGIQNYLAKQWRLQGRKYWIAIVLSAAFWSIAHANTLDPEWVKLAQVFPLGVALGFIFKKYGLEACIIIHALFNLIMQFFASDLIPT